MSGPRVPGAGSPGGELRAAASPGGRAPGGRPDAWWPCDPVSDAGLPAGSDVEWPRTPFPGAGAPRGTLVWPGPGWLATVRAEIGLAEVRSRDDRTPPAARHMLGLVGTRLSGDGLGRATSLWLVRCGRRCPAWAEGSHLHVVGWHEATRLRQERVLAYMAWWLAVPLLVYLSLVALLLLTGAGAAAAEPLPAGPPAAGWAWPLDGSPRVAREFAPPAQKYGRGHRGVDLLATPGAPVLAAGPGRVSYAGLLAGRGVVVVVHGELRTTYEPVTASVRVGQAVTAGERIGTLDAGHAGCPAAACLHWGLRRGEAYLDPLSLVATGPPRLLPLDRPALPADVPGWQAAAPPAPVGAGVSPAPEATTPEPPDQVVDGDREPVEWALRSATTPAGAAVLAALVVGLGLLARTWHPRGGPPAATAAASSVRPQDTVPGLVDLATERRRRREVA